MHVVVNGSTRVWDSRVVLLRAQIGQYVTVFVVAWTTICCVF